MTDRRDVTSDEVPTSGNDGHPGAELLVPMLQLIKLVAEEIGEPRAFSILERWAVAFVTDGVRRMRDELGIEGAGPRAFYDAMKAHSERLGERYSIIEESPDRILHRIDDCMYREACEQVGGIDMQAWGTCERVIPGCNNAAAAVVNPELEWIWRGCDHRPGSSCLFELRYRGRED